MNEKFEVFYCIINVSKVLKCFIIALNLIFFLLKTIVLPLRMEEKQIFSEKNRLLKCWKIYEKISVTRTES